MSSDVSVNRKASDERIIKLNSIGLSLSTIGGMLGYHPTTITLRLEKLGVPPADTRRSFMEDVYNGLTPAQQDWLADQLGPHHSIKDFVKSLLVDRYIRDINRPTTTAA